MNEQAWAIPDEENQKRAISDSILTYDNQTAEKASLFSLAPCSEIEKTKSRKDP